MNKGSKAEGHVDKSPSLLLAFFKASARSGDCLLANRGMID
ncbi:hypothetical protein CHCC20375_0378 [Bacillus licheniformis]|nr:hypothetical protein [Bacillus haynesii]TWK20747.1 hypothetical protein CHCC20375_0378 [Bacillus licheniformis]